MTDAHLRSWAAVAGLLTAAACGAVTGLALADRANTVTTHTLTLDDPRSTEDTRNALRSPGGFTGFEGLALAGPVKRTGEVTGVAGGAFQVVSGEATLQVQTTSSDRLYRIVAAQTPLSPGDVVVVRLDEPGDAVAVLRVPGDLRED